MFYENVKDLCALNRTNITQLAKDLGLSTSMPTKWKNGSIPKADTLQRIAEHFGVSTDALLAKNSPSNTIGNVTGSAVLQGNTGKTFNVSNGQTLNDDEKELLRIFRALPIRKRIELMRLAYEFEEN